MSAPSFEIRIAKVREIMEYGMKYLFPIILLALGAIGLLFPESFVVAPSALAANEMNTEGSDQAMGENGHMKRMQELRQRIPPQYSAMKSPPTPFGKADLAWGRAIFAEHCIRCHGVRGRGDGPLADGFASPVPDFQNGHHASFFNAGEKFWIVTNGVKGTPMPSFEGKLTERQRWLAVGYVLDLGRGGKEQ